MAKKTETDIRQEQVWDEHLAEVHIGVTRRTWRPSFWEPPFSCSC